MCRNRSTWMAVPIAGLLWGVSAWAAAPAPPLPSSFPGPLWEVVAPRGGTASVANAHLLLHVPGGSNHDLAIAANQAVRVLQPIGDEDFDVSIKIDSAISPTDEGTSQGLMVAAGDQEYLTFGLVTDGTNISLTARKMSGGVMTAIFQLTSFNDYHNPICLRLSRNRNAYTAYYSDDGEVWIEATSFTDTRVPIALGAFAANFNSTPDKAVPVVMAINWFRVL